MHRYLAALALGPAAWQGEKLNHSHRDPQLTGHILVVTHFAQPQVKCNVAIELGTEACSGPTIRSQKNRGNGRYRDGCRQAGETDKVGAAYQLRGFD